MDFPYDVKEITADIGQWSSSLKAWWPCSMLEREGCRPIKTRPTEHTQKKMENIRANDCAVEVLFFVKLNPNSKHAKETSYNP